MSQHRGAAEVLYLLPLHHIFLELSLLYVELVWLFFALDIISHMHARLVVISSPSFFSAIFFLWRLSWFSISSVLGDSFFFSAKIRNHYD